MFQVDDSQRGNQGNRFLTLGGGWVSQTTSPGFLPWTGGRKLYSYRGFKQHTQIHYLIQTGLCSKDIYV